MERPLKVHDHRYVGDKRTQVAYDLDEVEDETVIAELMASERYLTFAPDTPDEVRNRGYRLRSA